MNNHLSSCIRGASPDDQSSFGCNCFELQELHILDCDEYHQHNKKCCCDTCWCHSSNSKSRDYDKIGAMVEQIQEQFTKLDRKAKTIQELHATTWGNIFLHKLWLVRERMYELSDAAKDL